MKLNKIVLVLPLIVMIALFILGFQVISQGNTTQNAQLNESVTISINDPQSEDGKDTDIEVNWEWLLTPEDGVKGEGIIEVAFLNDKMESMENTFTWGTLKLFQSSDVIFETSETFQTENGGVAFQFPNKMEDNKIFGAVGQVRIVPSNENADISFVRVRYYHIWENEPYEIIKEVGVIDMLQQQEIDDYWVLERVERIHEGPAGN